MNPFSSSLLLVTFISLSFSSTFSLWSWLRSTSMVLVITSSFLALIWRRIACLDSYLSSIFFASWWSLAFISFFSSSFISLTFLWIYPRFFHRSSLFNATSLASLIIWKFTVPSPFSLLFFS